MKALGAIHVWNDCLKVLLSRLYGKPKDLIFICFRGNMALDQGLWPVFSMVRFRLITLLQDQLAICPFLLTKESCQMECLAGVGHFQILVTFFDRRFTFGPKSRSRVSLRHLVSCGGYHQLQICSPLVLFVNFCSSP
jgi:hypothetical protein